MCPLAHTAGAAIPSALSLVSCRVFWCCFTSFLNRSHGFCKKLNISTTLAQLHGGHALFKAVITLHRSTPSSSHIVLSSSHNSDRHPASPRLDCCETTVLASSGIVQSTSLLLVQRPATLSTPPTTTANNKRLRSKPPCSIQCISQVSGPSQKHIDRLKTSLHTSCRASTILQPTVTSTTKKATKR